MTSSTRSMLIRCSILAYGLSIPTLSSGQPSCSSDRPGWASHRTLHVPRKFVPKTAEENNWASALCCIYTHVEIWEDGSGISYLELFDGTEYSVGEGNFVATARRVMDDICVMQMGTQDCDSRRSCMDDALEKTRCTADKKLCPDGKTFVSRDFNNDCAFEPCPITRPTRGPTSNRCTAEMKSCPDGTQVSRDFNNGCAFRPCPITRCTTDKKLCSDGTQVSRDFNNGCAFRPCPVKKVVKTQDTACVDRFGSFALAGAPSSQRWSCKQIHFLWDRTTRKAVCDSTAEMTGEPLTSRCPVACASPACYSYVGSCRDSGDSFINLMTERTCAGVGSLDKTGALYTQICASYAEPDSIPVQEKCPSACLNTECTCADKEIPFVTLPVYHDDGNMLERVRERTCQSLYGIQHWEYRNLVCLLDIYAITPFYENTLKVYFMCPKACGFRQECFCRDSKKAIATPDDSRESRHCKHLAKYDDADKKCDETEDPVFARSCPVICKNPYCHALDRSDSRDTLSFRGGALTTTCALMALTSRDACDLMETDLNLRGSVLCPAACATSSFISMPDLATCESCVDAEQAWQGGECLERLIAPGLCPIADLDCCTEAKCCGPKEIPFGTCDSCVNNGFMWQESGCTDVVKNMLQPGTCPGEEGSCCTPDSLQDCCLARFPIISKPEPVDYCEACVEAGRAWQGECLDFIDSVYCPIADLECCTELACCGPQPQNEIGTCQECTDGKFMWQESGCSNVVEMLAPGMCPGEEGSCCTPDSLQECCLARFPIASEPEPVDYCEACVKMGRPFQGGACTDFIYENECPIADLECCTELACCGPQPQNEIGTCQECTDGDFMWTQSGLEGACSDVVEMLPLGMCPGEEGSCCTRGSLPKCCLQF